jgi:hypothetical protein
MCRWNATRITRCLSRVPDVLSGPFDTKTAPITLPDLMCQQETLQALDDSCNAEGSAA